MDDSQLALIGPRASEVMERIRRAARASGRCPEEIRVVGVSKKKPPEAILRAYEAGIREFGENYVQEAEGKVPLLPSGAMLHMVGSLQRNKARRAARAFDMVQSVDSIGLADALDIACMEQGRKMGVLIEVNIAGEPGKSGICASGINGLLAHFGYLGNITCEGLMVIPPVLGPREHFIRARELFELSRDNLFPNVDFKVLSMGMSSDFEEAIACGSTMVRIGRAIFGER